MIGIVLFLAVVLILLGLWQRHLDKTHKEATLARLQESHERGTRQAHAQYPQIKPYLCIGCGSCIQACPEDDVIGLVNGIAHIINGARCVGHARCQEACPVGAITVGLGDLRSRPDIPVLTPEMETSVPGIYIVGELGGMALIRNAIEQGTRVIDTLAAKMKTKPPALPAHTADVLIVGAGPAGLAATLRAREKNLSTITICQDNIGGTIRKYPRRKLTLVQDVTIPLYGKFPGNEYTKEQIIALWEQLIKKNSLSIRTHTLLENIARQGDFFQTQTTDGIISSRFIVLALGRRGTPRQLNVPGEDSEKVLYQLIDAATYTHQKVLVVGGGDSAIEIATGLANQLNNQVTLSYRQPNFVRLKPRNEQRIREYMTNKSIRVLFSSRVEKITGDSVTIKVDRPSGPEHLELPNNFVFVAAGGEPPYPLLKKIGIRFAGEDVDFGKTLKEAV